MRGARYLPSAMNGEGNWTVKLLLSAVRAPVNVDFYRERGKNNVSDSFNTLHKLQLQKNTDLKDSIPVRPVKYTQMEMYLKPRTTDRFVIKSSLFCLS